MSSYRVILRGESVHQEFSVNQSTNNLKEKVCLFSRKFGFSMRKNLQNIARNLVVFIFCDVCRVNLSNLLLFSVKIIRVSCFGDYGFSSEVPREGKRD